MEQVGGRRNELNKPVQPQQLKCPRCDSFHTKFCYYNNYSLSQPRYFCKTCRRYWTHGGTLRNVPVGGGCRKEKRAKTLSSVITSSNNFIGNYSLSQPLQSQSTIQSTVNVAGLTSYSPAVPFYQSSRGVGLGGGYVSSFAAFNNPSLNPNLSSQNFDPTLNVGSSSNLSLLQGFNVTHAGFGNSSQGQNRPNSQQLYQMFTSEEQQGLNTMNHSYTTSTSASAGSDNWPQSLINNGTNTNRAYDPSSLWNTISTPSINGGVSGSASLLQTQWPDLSGFNAAQ